MQSIMDKYNDLFAELARDSPETRDPTKETFEYFIWAFRKSGTYPEEHSSRCGKWLIFPEDDRVTETWRKVQMLTISGMLGGTSKVSTAQSRAYHDSYVICVYTYDRDDEEDKSRIKQALEDAGIRVARYKSDMETILGIG